MKGMFVRTGKKIKPVFSITVLVIIAVLIYAAALLYKDCKYTSSQPNTPVDVGFKVPEFNLKDVQGKSYSLDDLKGKVVLISFIDSQSAYSDKKSSDSRGELNFLKSMYKQYGEKGLNIFVIDSSYLDTGRDADHDKLANFSVDWELKENPLLIDNRSYKLADKYKVKVLPTTILINKEGVIDQRWDGLALPSQLALSIENLVGPPAYRTAGQGQVQPGIAETADGASDTPAQAKFAGMIPARRLSPNIWLVDGGKPWESNMSYPVRWLIMGDKSELQLKATAKNTATGETKILFEDKELEQIPDEDEKMILTNFGDISASTHIFMLATSIFVDKPGKYKIQASAYRSDNKTVPVYTGEALVTVQ